MSSFVENINIVANNINNGGEGSSIGQYYGKGSIKPIGFLAAESIANETITIKSGTNGFAIEDFILAEGSELIIEDGAVFKIL